MYSIYIKDSINGDQYEVPFLNASFTEELNAGRNGQFSFDYDVIKDMLDRYGKNVHFLFTGGLRELWVQKDDTKIYDGVLSDYQVGRTDKGKITMNVASIGYLNLLQKRRTGAKRIFSGEDAGLIAWTLIDESQQSDLPYSNLGITQGAIASSVERDRTFRFANIKEEIVQMSNNNLKNGFDVEVDNLKRFNVFYPFKGSYRENIIFDKGNTGIWQYKKPLVSSLTNRVYVLGDGFGDDVLYVTRTAPADYRYAFGLLEDVLNEKDVKTTPTLTDKGDAFLLKYQSPQVGVEVSHVDDMPDILEYEVGDTVRVTIEEMNLTKVTMRVWKRGVSINSDGVCSVSASLR